MAKRDPATRPPAAPLTRRQFGAGALAAGTAGVLGASLGAPAIAQGAVLKLGLVLPRSGYLAQAGQSCFRAAEIAPALIAADTGVKVEILSADFESNVELARARAEKLINDGAHVLVGCFDSGGTSAMAQVCEQRGIPLVINIGSAPQITEQGYKTVFRNFPTSPQLVRNGLGLIKDLFAVTGKTPKTAVFMHANDTFGESAKAAFDSFLPQLNFPFTVLDRIAYDPKAQDLSVEVAKAKATNAELLLVTTRAADAIMTVRELVKQRYEPMGVVSPGSPGMYDQQFYKTLGKYADFCITNVPWYSPRSDMTQRVAAAFKKQFPNETFEAHAFNVGFTYEAMLVAAQAFKRAGGSDPSALLAALRQTNIVDHMMIGGPISFDEKGQNNQIVSAAVQNRKQRPTVVLPKASAELDPVFPMPGWGQRS
jgi:branched-chain amino acid transport system substrate-binding protein